MRVVFDANPLFPLGPGLGPTGVGRWARGTISALSQVAPEWRLELVAFHLSDLQLETKSLGPNVHFRLGRFPNRVYRKLRALDALPPLEWLMGPMDAMVGPAYITWRTRAAAEIPVIHDLTFLRHASSVSRRNLVFLRLNVAKVVRRAAIVVTVSEAMRQEIISEFSLDEARVAVVPNGCDPTRFRPDAPAAGILVPERYVLFVGTLEPRKNLPAVLDALDQMRAETDTPPLVIAGGMGWRTGPLEQRLERAVSTGTVVLLGYVPDEALPGLYAKAELLLFPSLYEGFGLPVLEAMASGCPVVTSNRGGIPEVAGPAALLIDPDDPSALAEAASRVLNDEALRGRMVSAGLDRARLFSWRRSGLSMRTAIETATSSGG